MLREIVGIGRKQRRDFLLDRGFEERLCNEGNNLVPVVAPRERGLRVDISPANDAYFMKPLISAMATALGKTAPRGAKA